MFSKKYRNYVLVLLTLVYTLNFLDRNLLILLLQPIKEDLHLTDTQLGLLTGIAFGLFYATLGLPFARWADRGNRVTITSIAIGLWGVTVMIYIFVTNFPQMICGRIASSVGESGCMPPTYSLLGDYFPKPVERVGAMTFYWLGSPLSSLISFFLGGWLNERYGWRITFFIVGVPALVAAILVKRTIIEPRVSAGHAYGVGPQRPRVVDVFKALWDQQSSRHLSVAIVLLYMLSLGLAPWYAAFLVRSHGMHTVEVGRWLGAIFGAGGTAGILLGGYAAGRINPSHERNQLRVSAVAMVLAVPFFSLFLLAPRKHAALIALVPFVVVLATFLGPTFALMQRLVPDEMRSTSLAVVMLLANLIGMGIGPLAVGILSDLLSPRLAGDSLRYAMLAMSLVAPWAAYHLLRAGRTVARDLIAVASTSSSDAVSVA